MSCFLFFFVSINSSFINFLHYSQVYEKYGEKVEILTGVPKPKRGMHTAGEDKTKWAHRIPDPVVY